MDLSSGIAVLEEGGGCPIFEVLIRCHPPCLFQRGAGNFKMVIYTSTIFKLKSTKHYFQIYKIDNHQFSPLTLFLFSSPTFSMYFSSSVTQLCPTLRPHGLQHTRLPCPSPNQKFTQTHVHRVSDAIQPSHPLSSPSLPSFHLSQHQGFFQ